MWSYEKRVAADIDRWRQAGWLTAEAEAAIRADLAARPGGMGLAGILSILGAVLIGFAAMSFVAANWQEMPRVARLGLLMAGLWGSYAAAGALFGRGKDAIAHAAVLLGVALFGAAIMLVAQMYHIDGNPPDAVLTWALGAVLAGVVLGANPALAAGVLLIGLWGGWETAQQGKVYWPFLIGWAVASAPIVWRRWVPGLHLSAVALSLFIISIGYLTRGGHAHWIVALIGLGVAGAGVGLNRIIGAERSWPVILIGYGMVLAFAGLFAEQFLEPTRWSLHAAAQARWAKLAVLAVFTLALLLGAIYWGYVNRQRGILWLAYGSFSIEILGLYFETIGTLMGSSLFFLTVGLVVMALAYAATRLKQLAGAEAEGVR